jgi:hypothetical protein
MCRMGNRQGHVVPKLYTLCPSINGVDSLLFWFSISYVFDLHSI